MFIFEGNFLGQGQIFPISLSVFLNKCEQIDDLVNWSGFRIGFTNCGWAYDFKIDPFQKGMAGNVKVDH